MVHVPTHLLSFFFFVISVMETIANEGNTSKLEGRIVGGVNARPGAYPYQISIQDDNLHDCGGSLVKLRGRQFVITSAHCIFNKDTQKYLDMSKLKLFAGEVDLRAHSYRLQTRKVVKIIKHDKYPNDGLVNPMNLSPYDIAILLLDRPFQITPYVATIQLPVPFEEARNGVLTFSGWGELKDGGAYPDVLQVVDVPIVDVFECQKRYGVKWPWENYENFICAGTAPGGKDHCHGDSGGPAAFVTIDGRHFLAGIVTGSRGCAQPNVPGVSLKVSYKIDWMIDMLKKH